jgi:sulfoquinovosyltransferase
MSYHTNLPLYVRKYLPRFAWLEHVVWWLIRLAHFFADLTLVTSPQMREELEQHGVQRVDVWEKGINTKRFHPQYRDRDMRIKMSQGDPDAFLILYVGRLAAEKRVLDLKFIVDELPEDTRLCFVGAGPQERQLRSVFCDSRAYFMGQLHGEELSRAFASADILILPSDSETLGLVVLESMASGVPVIAARAGGIPSLIDDGVTSFLVTPCNTAEYVARLTELRNNEFRFGMGKLARQEAEKWSWESSMAYLRNVQYKQARENYTRRLLFRFLRWARRKGEKQENDKNG